jgi:HK97 family phage major capsid protein
MSHNMKAREAFEARMAAVEALKALDIEVGERAYNEEEKAQADRINADIDGFDAVIERSLREGELQARSAELDALVGKQHDQGMVEERSGLTPVELEARGLFLAPDAPEAKRSLEFAADAAEVARLARRDINKGTATEGAELIPTTLFGQLYVALREGATSMFSLGRSMVTPAGEQIDFPVATGYSAASLIAEGGAIGESDPAFSTIQLDAYKYGLAIQTTHEVEADNAVPGALPWVIEQAVDAIRRGVGAHLVTGDGTNKPNGIMNGTTTATATGVTFPTSDNLIAAYHSVVSGYRANASWLFNDATVAGIRTLKTSDNQYLWQPGLQAGQPDRILGRPVFTDDNVAEVGANAKIGVFGDIQRGYIVRTVGSIRAERSTDYAFLNDLATWRFLARFDGEIIDHNAFAVITNEAS